MSTRRLILHISDISTPRNIPAGFGAIGPLFSDAHSFQKQELFFCTVIAIMFLGTKTGRFLCGNVGVLVDINNS